MVVRGTVETEKGGGDRWLEGKEMWRCRRCFRQPNAEENEVGWLGREEVESIRRSEGSAKGDTVCEEAGVGETCNMGRGGYVRQVEKD